MSEKLVNVSTILMFGRIVEDVELKLDAGRKQKGSGDTEKVARHSVNRLLQKETGSAEGDAKPNLARIYAFAFEGHYYDLAKPTLFVVRGGGTKITADIEHTGLPADTLDFASDVMVWAYDKADFSIRLDSETGTFEQILLEAELGERSRTQYSGQGVRLSGQGVRFSGQGARFSGQGVRLRGGSGGED